MGIGFNYPQEPTSLWVFCIGKNLACRIKNPVLLLFQQRTSPQAEFKRLLIPTIPESYYVSYWQTIPEIPIPLKTDCTNRTRTIS